MPAEIKTQQPETDQKKTQEISIVPGPSLQGLLDKAKKLAENAKSPQTKELEILLKSSLNGEIQELCKSDLRQPPRG